jgi:hypothetical protein
VNEPTEKTHCRKQIPEQVSALSKIQNPEDKFSDISRRHLEDQEDPDHRTQSDEKLPSPEGYNQNVSQHVVKANPTGSAASHRVKLTILKRLIRGSTDYCR